MKRDIELILIKLTDGGRILRWSEPASCLWLENRIDAMHSIARQSLFRPTMTGLFAK